MAAGPSFAEKFIVYESRGSSMKEDQEVSGSEHLTLKAGQHVTLMSVSSGGMLQLDGPYDKAPDQERTTATYEEKLDRVFGSRSGEVGASRGTRYHLLPDATLTDATLGGNTCVLEGQDLVFWRPTTKGSDTLGIMPTDRSWKFAAKWPTGSDRLPVKRDVLRMDRNTMFYVSFDGVESAMRVIGIPDSLPNNVIRAAWMTEKGCLAQAEAMLKTAK
jgi:hypothetical protein